jgi:hypothetical protein
MRRISPVGWFLLCGPILFFGLASRSDAAPITAFNANVNEWSSSTVGNSGAGIYPIGGSGEVNGGFVVTTGSDGAQIGLRAELRFMGSLPQTNNGITATYYAPTGTSGGNLSLWNFEADIDLRNTGHNISDYSAIFTVTDRSDLVTPVDLVASGVVPANAVLYQNSENPGFSFLSSVFPAFDPTAPGVYAFDLKLTPTTFTGDTLEASINVDVAAVPEPSPLALVASGAAALIIGRWRRRERALIN